MALAAALFPPDHPYHWLTIGDPEDLRAATLDDVQTFFETYYHPGNASLALAGDIETARALDLAERYFGEIPRGPVPPPVNAGIPITAEPSLLLEDRVELPRLYLSWHSPAMFHAGDAELDLGADVLAHGKTSRLYKRLVYERRVAADVSAYQHSRELSGVFQVAAPPRPACRCRCWRKPSPRRCTRWRRRAPPPTNWRGRRRRRKRSSSIGCRRWAASAASPIS